MSETRTITLTNRPPVKIREDAWPVIANASDKDYDNQYEFQANRTWKWFINVRQHEDGRTLVYAGFAYTTAFQSERGYRIRHGKLLTEETSQQAIVDAIVDVCDDMATAQHDSDESAARWRELARDCIADLPADELA